MSKNVLSMILFSLFLGCGNKSRPLGGGSLHAPVGGESDGSHGEGEGEGEWNPTLPSEGEGRGEGEGADPIAGEGEGAVNTCENERLTVCPRAGCVNLQDNPEHCGACGTVCDRLTTQDDWISTCVTGACRCFRNLWRECGASCQQFGDDMLCLSDSCAAPASGFIPCNARCVDSLGDNDNCGSCENSCGENEQCIEGLCSRCPDARERWCPKRWEGFECINVQNHPANCGECGMRCNDFGYQCVDGACVCKRDADRCELEGGELCTDLTRDWDNCGVCGNRCPRGSECPHGQCGECMQSWDQEQCNGDCIVCEGMADVTDGFNSACVVTATDEMNCGRCGNRCAPDQRCEAGRCVN